MSEIPVRERLKQIVAAHLDGRAAPESIGDDTGLYGHGLGLSSLDIVALVIHIESEFDVFLEAEEVAESVESFGRLLRTLETKMGSA